MATPSTDPHLFGRAHNHQQCIADALASARQICQHNGARLTALRRRMLELIWSSHKPVLAYELLRRIQRDKPTAAPPTVYRALDFLLKQGLIHRIESLNAYTGCSSPRTPHNGLFLICTRCREIVELEATAIGSAISTHIEQSGFRAEHQTLEIRGACAACR